MPVSTLWDFFEKCGGDTRMAVCKYCHKELSYKTTITNLKQHLKIKHKSAYNSLLNYEEDYKPAATLTCDAAVAANDSEHNESLRNTEKLEFSIARAGSTETSASDPLAEFQADEEEVFGVAARSKSLAPRSPPVATVKSRPKIRVAASAPPPLPASANPLMWPAEEAVPRLRPGANSDECQIFGDFVASELRTLRSDESRKKLKRMIQKAILKVGEEEDVNIISG